MRTTYAYLGFSCVHVCDDQTLFPAAFGTAMSSMVRQLEHVKHAHGIILTAACGSRSSKTGNNDMGWQPYAPRCLPVLLSS